MLSCVYIFYISRQVTTKQKILVMPVPPAISTLLDANVTEQLEVKASDSLAAIVQKQCLRLGGYRLPPSPCSTMDDVESLVEVWPLIFVSEENNTLGNIKSAIRSISATVQPHIIKQLANTADSIYRIIKCDKLKLKETPTGEDLTAMQLWQVVEPSILIGRALVNYLKGKVPKAVVASATPTPTQPASQDLSLSSIQSMIQSSISKAMMGRGGNGNGSTGGNGHGSKRGGNQSQQNGKRRRF